MNKLVLVLLIIIFVSAIVLSFLYFFSSNIQHLFSPSAESVSQLASNNCRETGIAVQQEAVPYLDVLSGKIGLGKDPQKTIMSVFKIDGTCWGIWAGDGKGNGNLYYEDKDGNLISVKSTFSLK